jgi:disulfide bond formation protein DsbB
MLGCMALGAFGAAVLAYILETYAAVPACRLCYVERLCLVVTAFCTAVLAWRTLNPQRIGTQGLRYVTCCMWAFTAGVAGYHAGIVYEWWAVPAFCQVSQASSLESFLSTAKALCNQRTLDILGIPACVWLCGASALGGILTWIISGVRSTPGASKRLF